MSMINCPECGKVISDTATTCPNCGYVLKKKKPAWIIVLAIIMGIVAIIVLASGFKDLFISKEIGSDKKQQVSEEKNAESQKTAFQFEVSTDEDLVGFPDAQGFTEVSDGEFKTAMVSIGVKDISDVEIGNYKEKSGVYFLDAKCKTDTGIPLIIDYMYISFSSDPEWTICYIADYDSGKYYYVSEESENEVDIYDYKTGELKSKANPSSNSN